MTTLITLATSGKGTWTAPLKMVKMEEFKQVFLITEAWAKDKITIERENLNIITINSEDSVTAMRDKLITEFKGRIKGFEVAVNIDSGTGKEHTALLSALLKVGLGFRFVILDDEKVKDLTGNEGDFFES